MKLIKLSVIAVILLITLSVTGVSAQGFSTVNPTMLDLTLGLGESTTEQVSITIHPLCIRPIDVDVVASDPGAQVNNLSGVITNSCGGDMSTFDVEITGTGSPQAFDLQFVDAEFGGLLDSIPVTINASSPRVEHIMGLRILSQGIEFQVESSGCTTRDDFQVEVQRTNPLQVRLLRIQEDPCDAFEPLGTKIRYRYRDLGIGAGAQYQVINPLAVIQRRSRP